MEQVAPIVTALALLIGAVGGLSLRRSARERELSERAERAERTAHRRLTLIRRVEVWLIENRLFEDVPTSLRDDLEEEANL